MSEHRIVVGFDGSPDAAAAVRWAAEQAHRMGFRLQVVHSYDFPYLERLDPTTQNRLREQAEAVGRDGARLARALRPDVTVEVVVRSGSPAHVMIDAARGADMLVIGSRGENRAHHMILGSVATRCVHHAPCSVAVIRS